MVAEKPSVAKSMMEFLGRGKNIRKVSWISMLYKFEILVCGKI
jgi:hypothetical protein